MALTHNSTAIVVAAQLAVGDMLVDPTETLFGVYVVAKVTHEEDDIAGGTLCVLDLGGFVLAVDDSDLFYVVVG